MLHLSVFFSPPLFVALHLRGVFILSTSLLSPPPLPLPLLFALKKKAGVGRGDATKMAVFGQKAPEAVETESWKVWFDSQLPRGLTLEEYRQRVLLVSEVGSLTDLEQGDMAAYNNFDFVPEKESTKTGASDRSERNPFRFNLRIFKESLAPFWEDMPDTAVIYTLKFPSKLSPINVCL